jgi:hypothetical protein
MDQAQISELERKAAISTLESFARWLDAQADPCEAPDELRRRIVALQSVGASHTAAGTTC